MTNAIPLRAARTFLYLGLALAIIPYGAVHDGFFFVSLLLVGLSLVLACFLGPNREPVRALYRMTLAVVVLTSAYVLLQSVQFSGHPLAHAIWDTAARPGFDSGGISVDPTATRRALLTLLLPFAVFLAAIALHDDDEAAMLLYRRLAWFGIAIAVFGLVQHLVFPGTLFLASRSSSQGSLTAVFVNRNSTATLLGMTLLLCAGLLLDRYLRLERARIVERLLKPRFSLSDRYSSFFLMVVFTALVAVALVLTVSRAGVLAAFAALSLVLLWAGLRYGMARAPIWKRAAFSVLFASGAIAALSSISARVALRIERQGIDDGRFCVFEATSRAIGDHWLLGAGFGAFPSVFPLYRDPDCLFPFVLDMAHNSYIEGYLGLGLAFVPILAACLFVLVRAFWRGMRYRRRYRFAGAIGFALIVQMGLHSLFDFSLQITGVAAYFAAALAATGVLSVGRTRRRTGVQATPKPGTSKANMSAQARESFSGGT